MKINDLISIFGAVISALCAGISFKFYNKTVNVIKGKNKINKNIIQKSGNGSINNIGDNNHF